MLIRTRGRNHLSPGIWDEREKRCWYLHKGRLERGHAGKTGARMQRVQNGALTMRENDYQPLSPLQHNSIIKHVCCMLFEPAMAFYNLTLPLFLCTVYKRGYIMQWKYLGCLNYVLHVYHYLQYA